MIADTSIAQSKTTQVKLAEISQRERRILLILILVALALRIAALAFWRPIEFEGDEVAYSSMAQSWASSGHMEATSHPPGYAWFLGVIWRMSTHPIGVARLAQIVLSALCVPLMFLIARRDLGSRAALWGAGLFAVDPTMVFYSHYLFSETLFTFVVLIGTLPLLSAFRDQSWRGAAVAGAFYGAATLIRSGMVAQLGLVGIALAFAGARVRSAWLRTFVLAGIFATAWAVVVLPYSYTISRHFGGFMLVDLTGIRAIWHANRVEYEPGYDCNVTPKRIEASGQQWGVTPIDKVPETPRAYAAVAKQERQFTLTHPGLVLSRVPKKLAALWNPTTFIHRRIARGNVTGVDRHSNVAAVVCGAISIFYAATLFLAVMGLWHARPGPLRSITLATLLSYCIVHAILVSMSRYRVPLMPFLFMFTGATVCHWREYISGRSWRTFAAIGCMLMLLGSWYPYCRHVFLQVDETDRLTAAARQREAGPAQQKTDDQTAPTRRDAEQR